MSEQSVKERVISTVKPVTCTVASNTLVRLRSLEVVAQTSEEKRRLAVPRRGHVLSTIVEMYAEPVRIAVDVLSRSLSEKQRSAFEYLSVARHEEEAIFRRSDSETAAWAVVSMWIVGVAAEVFTAAASLGDAEDWFCSSYTTERITRSLPSDVLKNAEANLRIAADGSAYAELLPYILDPHGPGSRLSVRRNPNSRSARVRKRAEGVFYTPADVAEYMVQACLAEVKSEGLPSVFDPACGTGVFLRASLKEIRRRYPELGAFYLASECLFGVDIDPWPVNAAAFVLLFDSYTALDRNAVMPVEAWRRLRRNFACIDALRIDPSDGLAGAGGASRIPTSTLFPTIKKGFTITLGNPPYADLGRRLDLNSLARVFKSIEVKPQPTAEVYLPFVEQMIRLGNEEMCCGALVLPLSFACNVGLQFSTLRHLISESRGCWRFAFFDREPHALFGEDVKTRNTILLWSRSPSDKRPSLLTGPLRKWRGDSRAAMFKSVNFTAIHSEIRSGIPKLEGNYQAAAFNILSLRGQKLQQVVAINRVNLAEAPDSDDKTLFVGATAYNFINVFMRPEKCVLDGERVLSEHQLHVVRCATRKSALAIFAILTSHLAYWWWHVHGDGFHVSRRFISDLPIGAEDLTEELVDVLSEDGLKLWNRIKARPIMSLNRGRVSLAYSPNGHNDIRRDIDQRLGKLTGLTEAFINDLQQFTARTVAASLQKYGN